MNPFAQGPDDADPTTEVAALGQVAHVSHTHELAEILLSQLRTAFQSSTQMGSKGWSDLLRRFRGKTNADALFIFDTRGLVIASSEGLDPDEEELAAAKLSAAFPHTADLGSSEALSISVRYQRRWLTVFRFDSVDEHRLYMAALSNKPIEPALGPPDHIGRGRWNNFLSWALGSSPSTEAFLVDGSALLVESTHDERMMDHEVAGSRLVQLYEHLNKLFIGYGSVQVAILRYPESWLSSVRVRRSSAQTLVAGVRGPTPLTPGRADDIRRSLWQIMARSFVSPRSF